MAGIRHTILRRDTTIDPEGSNKHARDKGAIIIKPEITFFQTIQKSGLPSIWVRHCCAYLKEKHGLDVAIQGIRRDESQARAKRYKEPTVCRLYPHKQRTEVFLPILEWTKEDLKEFVEQEHIQCHPLYYDENGDFHAERRLGCIGCPLAPQKERIEQLKAHPKFIKQYCKNVYIYRENQTKKRMEKGMSYEEAFKPFSIFKDEYGAVFFNIFCKNTEDFVRKTTGMFGNLDCKQFLEDYFKIDLP